MRILRDYGLGVGALIVVMGLIAATSIPERQTQALIVSALGAAVFLAGILLNRARLGAVLRGKTARAAGASAGYTLLVLAVVVLINFLSARHHKRFDLTENHEFSLSEQTVKVLESLPRDVTITSFSRDGDPGRQKLQDLLEEYAYRSRKLTIHYIDPDKNPGEVRRYNVTELGAIVIESGKQEARVNSSDEESLTNALIKVTSDKERVVYATTGHGEHDLGDSGRDGLSALKLALEKQNYVVRPLVLNQGVPADASALLIPGADKPLMPAEVTMVSDYLDRGGRVMLMQDPGADPGLGEVTAKYGAAVRKDVIIDKVSQLFGGDARIPMVAPEGYDKGHPITKTFGYQTIYPLASSIDLKSPAPDGVTTTALAKTSEMSWGETSTDEIKSGRIQMTDGVDTRGPLTIAAALERKGGPTPSGADATPAETGKPPAGSGSRMFLVGDADFVSNNYFNAGGNGDLALNGIAWLVEQGELISIRAKSQEPRVVILSPGQVFYYFWTIVAIAPIAIALCGVAIWWRRKRL